MNDIQKFAEQYQLSISFFEHNPAKSNIWIQKAYEINHMLQEKNIGIVTPTSGGKTVMALLSVIIEPKRTLFLVPMRRLTKNHQRLYEAMGGKLPTRIITGETTEFQRIWDNQTEQIVFATGHVVQSELKKSATWLDSFDFVVFDEMHNAKAHSSPYAEIAKVVAKKQITRLALSASPGNSETEAKLIKLHCQLDDIIRIQTPVAEQIISVVHAEESESFFSQEYQTCLNILLNKTSQAAFQLKELIDNNFTILFGLSIPQVYPVGYNELKLLREQLCWLPDCKQQKIIMSKFWELHGWNHCLNLFVAESFEALRTYCKKLQGKKAFYARVIREDLGLKYILGLSEKLMHPKLNLLVQILESLMRREKQFLIFVQNEATANDICEYLNRLKIPTAKMFGGKKMKLAEQEKALELLEESEVKGIVATTVIREGFNLTVDVIINHTPPSSAIDAIQRSGRAGRRDNPAEIINLAYGFERLILHQLNRNMRKVNQMNLDALGDSSEVSPVAVSPQVFFQPSLF